MRRLSYKSHGMVGIGIREEECIEVITTAKRNNKEDSGRTGKYYAEGGLDHDTKKTKTFPVFINYDKAEDISDTTKYEDHFTSSSSLIAISKSGRSVASEDVQNFLHAKERGIQVHLFVRKNKDDKISKEFYYLGYMQASGKVREFIMPNTDKTAVENEWLLDVPVREDLYEYIVNE